ncbi:hypothetical protein [Pelagicoccus sp. SDUM812002]|uniref:hypothetical protein n=1 Tax=Pelagicoccus sp. SDUM812002 TaxID=3041266 RepID=UPI00280FE48B|nr:hypothetical protein [Pelagicoccus sp. SDUM812002]MDQ8187933.1 hypothetical protein [Pelagicoccus sp. SDUM812002]
MSDSLASGLPDGRYAPRRPGEPPSHQRLQRQSYSSQPHYQQPRQTQAYNYFQPVRPQSEPVQYSQTPRPFTHTSQLAVASPSQRFAPTRPDEKWGRARPKEKISTRSVKTAYKIYKGYHSIKQATAVAQARPAEELFVEAVEDTTSPPTMAKIITYPIKLVASVIVEVVRTVAVDWWRR